MKRLLGMFLAIVLCSLASAMAVYAVENALVLESPKENVKTGETFNIEITAKDIDQIAGTDILLYYDSTKLSLLSKRIHIPKEDIIDIQESVTGLEDEAGKVKLIFGLKKDRALLTGENQALATLTFEALEAGETEMSIHQDSQLIQEILVEKFLAYQYSNPKISPSIRIRITEPHPPLERLKEDVDGDGIVDITDLVLVGARYGMKRGDGDWMEAADINQDGEIDLRDVLYISRLLE